MKEGIHQWGMKTIFRKKKGASSGRPLFFIWIPFSYMHFLLLIIHPLLSISCGIVSPAYSVHPASYFLLLMLFQ